MNNQQFFHPNLGLKDFFNSNCICSQLQFHKLLEQAMSSIKLLQDSTTVINHLTRVSEQQKNDIINLTKLVKQQHVQIEQLNIILEIFQKREQLHINHIFEQQVNIINLTK